MKQTENSESALGDSDVDVLIVDWHGGLRGKRLPISMRGKIAEGEAKTIASLSIIGGVGGEGGRPTSFNDGGQLAFRAIFTDGTAEVLTIYLLGGRS